MRVVSSISPASCPVERSSKEQAGRSTPSICWGYEFRRKVTMEFPTEWIAQTLATARRYSPEPSGEGSGAP